MLILKKDLNSGSTCRKLDSGIFLILIREKNWVTFNFPSANWSAISSRNAGNKSPTGADTPPL